MTIARSRTSTIRHELATDMTPAPEPLHLDERVLRSHLLKLDGTCEYCGKTLNAKWRKGDHMFPVINKGLPTVYCNDDWNMIPCCAGCNSSKRGMYWKDWLTSDVNGNPLKLMSAEDGEKIIEKFTTYEKYMQKYCQRRAIDKNLFDRCMNIYEKAVNDIDTILKKELPRLCTYRYHDTDPLREDILAVISSKDDYKHLLSSPREGNHFITKLVLQEYDKKHRSKRINR